MEDDYTADARYGHTACVYGKRVIIYGGMKRIKQDKKQASVYPELLVMNTQELVKPINEREVFSRPIITEVTSPKGKKVKALDLIPPKRRNHVACIVADEMLIHGGISEDDVMLESMFVLNLQIYSWMPARIKAPLDKEAWQAGLSHTQIFKFHDDGQ